MAEIPAPYNALCVDTVIFVWIHTVLIQFIGIPLSITNKKMNNVKI